jgi:energy-coupling factor transporter ATP-binding protein EcfA2
MNLFSITQDQLAPIISFTHQNDPVVDFSKMSDWGIVFICCGALVGQTSSGKAKLLKHLNAPLTPEAILDRGDDEYYAEVLAELIEDWAQDTLGISLAKQRLKASGKFSSENYGVMLPYFSIAIMLNSLTNLDTEQFRKLKVRVSKSELRWPGFFFAAGLLLSSKPQVKWDQWASALIGISGLAKPQLKDLFDSCSKEK